jgi:orsellinic acid C2-O-methyltransferase
MQRSPLKDPVSGIEAAPTLMALVSAAAMSQAVCVAAELRLPDLLANGPRTATELAEATGSHTPSLHRLLRALASVDVCSERDDGTFALGAMGALLRGDAPNGLRSWTIWCGGYMWPVWGKLRDSVRTGKSVQQLAGGTEGFGHLVHDPKAAADFNAAMVELTRLIADEVIRAYDFAGIRRIVDIGGGHGALVTAILKANPGMRGAVFDLPHAIEGAKAYLANEGIADRCDFIAGDFFESIPGGGDAYLLKNIIHDWNDERSIVLLRNCRQAMPPNGRLLVVEQVTPGRLEALPAHRALAWTDLAMLISPGGRQRTKAEFCALFATAGLAVARTIHTALGYSIIECVSK